MSRRRDLSPTLERKEGQLEVVGRQLAKAQGRERDTKRELAHSRAETRTVLEQLAQAQVTIKQQAADIARLEAWCHSLTHLPSHEEAAPPAPEPARSWHQRLLSKITPTA